MLTTGRRHPWTTSISNGPPGTSLGELATRNASIVAAEEAFLAPGVPRTALNFRVEAVRRVCQRAGIPISAIDGVAVSVSADLRPGQMPALELANELGLSPSFIDSTLAGGVSPVIQVARAARALNDGACTVAVVAYGSVQASTRLRRKDGWRASSGILADEMLVSTGWRNPISAHALIAARHMHDYGTTAEDLATVAVSQRMWAAMNPAAHRREQLTVQEVLDSPIVSWPLHVLDCCLITDGGGAVLMCRREDVDSSLSPPISILGFDELHTHQSLLTAASLTVSGAARTGARAMERAGLATSDIDVVQLYDAFTDMPIILLEDLGFCAKGDGGKVFRSGRTQPGGDLPVNTQGGGLSHCHPGMYGIYLVIEAVSQLQGRAGPRQQGDVAHVLCHGVGGGAFGSHATLVLGRS